MQNAPIVQLPEQKHRHDWGMIVASLAIILVMLVAVVLIAQPELWATSPAANPAANPEIATFQRFQAERTTLEQPAPVSANPEIAAYNRYLELHPKDQVLRENPEVRVFQQWQAEQ